MSSNVGLTTPRGSGTSGYVQRNLSHLRPRDNGAGAPYRKDFDLLQHTQRQPDKEILEHDRKREIEVKVFELRDKLEDDGVEEDDIEDQCTALRNKLQQEQAGKKHVGPNARGLKSHQVHELAKAKIEESEKLRKALGIKEDYEEGSHWRRQETKAKRFADGEKEREKKRADSDEYSD